MRLRLGTKLFTWLVLSCIAKKKEEGASGYEIITWIILITEETVSPGSIYPFLHGLEDKGYITGKQEFFRRRKKLYKLTWQGRDLLTRLDEFFELVRNKVKL